MDVFSKTALEAHNKRRSEHNVAALSWSNDLARSAQVWANKLAKEGKLKHDQLKGVGENVFMSSQGFDTAAEEATKSWYSEIQRYDFKTGGYQSGTGHFTQVVWKDSEELGMARAKSADGSVFVVARYRPAGNNLSSFDGNVLPKIFSDEEKPQEKANLPKETLSSVKEDPSKDIKSIPISSLDDAFIEKVLQVHNELRSLHNVPLLKWSSLLSREAKVWAEKLSKSGELCHASKEERKYKGENICRMSSHYDAADAVRVWYSEIKNYNYDLPGFSLDTGHFSQIVWRDTREVGVGTSKSPDGRLTYMVARYNPPGNVLKKFQENVTPLAS